MKIAITGATGFIGQAICDYLSTSTPHKTVGFSRRLPVENKRADEWRKAGETLDFSGCDAVIHLIGEPIFGRWTSTKKQRILQSRVIWTRRVVDAISRTPDVKCFIATSAIGYYGDTGDSVCDEDSPSGDGFLADVCRAWEEESSRAKEFVRTIQLRLGLVLGASGGAFPLMKSVFRAGLGGRLGSGFQWMSCVHVEDVARLALFCMEQPEVSGPMNAVMQKPIRNKEFTYEMARAVHRFPLFPVPAFFLRWLLGDFSHLFLDSQYVLPKRALQAGYSFVYPTVREAVKALVE
jgi:uncharacterized protein